MPAADRPDDRPGKQAERQTNPGGDETVTLFGTVKGPALASFGAAAYVGDHVADIEAARAGGTVSVAVATGLYRAGELRDHGADVTLEDLTEFAEWFDG